VNKFFFKEGKTKKGFTKQFEVDLILLLKLCQKQFIAIIGKIKKLYQKKDNVSIEY